MVHSALPLKTSESSLASSGCGGPAYALCVSGKSKKDLLQRSFWLTRLHAQLVERANPPHLPTGKKNETIASPLCVCKLVYGQNEVASLRRFVAKDIDDVTGLTK